MDYAACFESGLEYGPFLQKYGTDEQRRRFAAVHAGVHLTADQKLLLQGFRREMKLICLAGAWCGDCVNQMPILDHFAAIAPVIRIRYFDRDDNPALHDRLSICGGARVPSVLFLSEDNFPCGMYGDRTLSRYRELASQLDGAACSITTSTPAVDHLTNWTSDWLQEFERIQLMLRLSARLRQKHSD